MQQELFEIGKALSRIADVMEANQKGAEVVSPSASPNNESFQLLCGIKDLLESFKLSVGDSVRVGEQDALDTIIDMVNELHSATKNVS